MSAPIPVFAGPSLAGETLGPQFERLPPAGAGDMLRLLARPPSTVVLIDGVFGSRPAVWHKEVLVLLARGWRVIGAASMGALRAAELHPFGMIGMGAIYRAYASGQIVADDEVAVTHAPAKLGAAPLSLAQVDVRATLARAVHARAIDGASARTLRDVSGAIFYRDRTWASVIDAGLRCGLDLVWFEAWLSPGAFSQKRSDALAALAFAAEANGSMPPHPEPPRTCFLEALAAWTEVMF